MQNDMARLREEKNNVSRFREEKTNLSRMREEKNDTSRVYEEKNNTSRTKEKSGPGSNTSREKVVESEKQSDTVSIINSNLEKQHSNRYQFADFDKMYNPYKVIFSQRKRLLIISR